MDDLNKLRQTYYYLLSIRDGNDKKDKGNLISITELMCVYKNHNSMNV